MALGFIESARSPEEAKSEDSCVEECDAESFSWESNAAGAGAEFQ